jgi:MSHA biogenesis protein MshM
MYYDYFGLKQPPFKITPDTSLFYPGGERGVVLEALMYAILNGEGIVKVVGEVGSGKTMLCRMLEKELPDKVEIVYLANPSLSPENILHAIAFELKLELPPGASRFEVMNSLQNYLLQRHSQGRQVVVFVEEAQSMPLRTLEEIRLLSNLETQHNKLLQIILFGQPELDEMIATPQIRQLKERITYSFRLNPFATDDIREYLNSRLHACGYRAGTLFDRTAIREVEYYSRGLLRRINILADKALLAAYADNTHTVTGAHIRQAAKDSEFVSDARRWWLRPAWLMAAIAAVVILAALLWTLVWPPAAGVARVAPPQSPATADTAAGGERVPAAAERNAEPDAGSAAGTAAPAPAAPVTRAGEEDVSSEKSPGASTTAAPATAAAPRREHNGQSSTGAGSAPAGAVIELGTVDGSSLSPDESRRLRRELERYPPESALLSGFPRENGACRLCYSLIYRPLSHPENL